MIQVVGGQIDGEAVLIGIRHRLPVLRQVHRVVSVSEAALAGVGRHQGLERLLVDAVVIA